MGAPSAAGDAFGERVMEQNLRVAYEHLVRRGAGQGSAGYVLTGERGSGLTVRRGRRRRVDLQVEAAGHRRRFALLPTGSFVEQALPPDEGAWVAEFHPESRPPEIVVLAGAHGESDVFRLPPTLAAEAPADLMGALEPLSPLPLHGKNGLLGTLALGEYVGLDLSLRTGGASYRVHWSDVVQEHGDAPAPARLRPVWFRTYAHGPHQWLEVRAADEVVDRFDITAL
ncbi:MAG: hypothetical protein QOD77_1102 [Thermoplasmata archaeon]|jgi:hypothetical protein|nr:hypothetical protein [Thermoplasmata archaeon]